MQIWWWRRKRSVAVLPVLRFYLDYYTQRTDHHYSCFYEVGGLKYIINHININISQQGNTSATPLWPPTW